MIVIRKKKNHPRKTFVYADSRMDIGYKFRDAFFFIIFTNFLNDFYYSWLYKRNIMYSHEKSRLIWLWYAWLWYDWLSMISYACMFNVFHVLRKWAKKKITPLSTHWSIGYVCVYECYWRYGYCYVFFAVLV